MTVPASTVSRPRIWAWVALAIFLSFSVVTTGFGLGYAVGDFASRTGVHGEQVDAGPRQEMEWQRLLNVRADALRAGDLKAFLTTIDHTDEFFVRDQLEYFHNVSQLPLKEWKYRLLSGKSFYEPEADYPVPYDIYSVELKYQLRGFDYQPIARPLGITFVQRDDDWLIGGVSDVNDRLPLGAGAEPWDVGPINVSIGESSLVVTDAATADSADELLAQTEASVSSVSRMWRGPWNDKAVVIAVDNEDVWLTLFNDQRSPDNFVAVATPVSTQVTGWDYDDWGDLAGSRVVVSPTGLDIASNKYVAETIEHEVTHVATMKYTFFGAPRWIVEGAADHTSYRNRAMPFAAYQRAAESLEEAGELPSSVTFYQTEVRQNYANSWLLCAFLAERSGDKRFTEFYKVAAASGTHVQSQGETEHALRRFYDMTPEELVSLATEWGMAGGPAFD